MDDSMVLKCLQEIADEYFDGHFTIMKFTTNWKISFNTPIEYDDVQMKMFTGATIYDAFKNLIGIGLGGDPAKDLRAKITLGDSIVKEIEEMDLFSTKNIEPIRSRHE